MKYPQAQLEKVKTVLTKLDSLNVDYSKMHPCSIQFLVFQQYSSGQLHNSLVNTPNGIFRRATAEAMKVDYTVLFETDDTFELYPEGCNDSHVETGIKYVLKQINK